uniref:Transmembrane protein n=1 Tax=Medicago truncatula TaxID=3880 RepID=Q2HRF9_MEDTR|nr:hypothetical protein MtrDRAFT_AC158502g23v2 [Medicago truncatula]
MIVLRHTLSGVVAWCSYRLNAVYIESTISRILITQLMILNVELDNMVKLVDMCNIQLPMEVVFTGSFPDCRCVASLHRNCRAFHLGEDFHGRISESVLLENCNQVHNPIMIAIVFVIDYLKLIVIGVLNWIIFLLVMDIVG